MPVPRSLLGAPAATGVSADEIHLSRWPGRLSMDEVMMVPESIVQPSSEVYAASVPRPRLLA
jgi:hypothetical protein